MVRFFYENPVFRLEELVAWKASHGSSKAASVQNLIQYYLNSGRLCRIRRKLYAVVPPNISKENLTVDPYILAGKVTHDSVLAYHTALELYGVAYSSFGQSYYLSKQKIKQFEFNSHFFKPVRWLGSLRKLADDDYEIDSINRQGVNLRITSLPRTFVDVLDRVELSGGWEEVVRSISNINVLDIDRTISYCLKLENATLAAKVGYFLEQREGAFSPTEEQLAILLKSKPLSPQYLSKKRTKPCRLIKKWNIMIPVNIDNKNWEEPEDDL